jgi:hypothetical protein
MRFLKAGSETGPIDVGQPPFESVSLLLCKASGVFEPLGALCPEPALSGIGVVLKADCDVGVAKDEGGVSGRSECCTLRELGDGGGAFRLLFGQ